MPLTLYEVLVEVQNFVCARMISDQVELLLCTLVVR